MIAKQGNLTSGKRLSRNVFWNIIGTGAPLIVAVIAIPILIDNLGKDRFGVLSIAWMVVGYFSLFDMGLGRALTKLVAEKLGKQQQEEVPSLVLTTLLLMTGLGLLGGFVVSMLSPWLVESVFKIPSGLEHEVLLSFYVLAASVPIVILVTALRGMLEAYQRFDFVNAVRIPVGSLTFLAPMCVIPFSNSLVPLVSILVVVRLLSCLVYATLCLTVEPKLFRALSIDFSIIRQLFSFGGWMTVTNIIGPIMVYMDRFFIGAMISMTAVTYYATPYEVITKLWIVPAAIMGVMFPAFTTSLAQAGDTTGRLFSRTISFLFISLFPIVLIIVTFSHEGLALWIGNEFADSSSSVLKILALGVFLNSFAQVPFGLIQGAGHPDLTAKLHLIELPFYLILLWWLLDHYGIIGAAIAWVLRISCDTLFLFTIAGRFLSTTPIFTPRTTLIAVIALSLIILGGVIPGIFSKLFFLVLVMLFFFSAAWFFVLASKDREIIFNLFKKMAVPFQ